jgi:hypothetical protein
VATLTGGIEGPGAELSEHLLDAGEVAGVAARVEVEHQRLALGQQPAHHRPAEALGFCAAVKAGAAVTRMRRRPASRERTSGGLTGGGGGDIKRQGSTGVLKLCWLESCGAA